MAENQTKCTGNCMACTILQRQYCASQLAYSNMRMLEQVQKELADIEKKIEAMQNNEATLFYPTIEDSVYNQQEETIAQSGDGAVK